MKRVAESDTEVGFGVAKPPEENWGLSAAELALLAFSRWKLGSLIDTKLRFKKSRFPPLARPGNPPKNGGPGAEPPGKILGFALAKTRKN